MTTRQTADLLRIARRNRWTLCYLAVITTALFVLMVIEVWSNHA